MWEGAVGSTVSCLLESVPGCQPEQPVGHTGTGMVTSCREFCSTGHVGPKPMWSDGHCGCTGLGLTFQSKDATSSLGGKDSRKGRTEAEEGSTGYTSFRMGRPWSKWGKWRGRLEFKVPNFSFRKVTLNLVGSGILIAGSAHQRGE